MRRRTNQDGPVEVRTSLDDVTHRRLSILAVTRRVTITDLLRDFVLAGLERAASTSTPEGGGNDNP